VVGGYLYVLSALILIPTSAKEFRVLCEEPLTVGQKPEASRAAAFDPWRIAASDRMRRLVAEAVRGILHTEVQFKMRKRQRRPEDARIFRELVEALVCDVAYQHLMGRPIRVPRDTSKLARASRYSPKLLSKQLPHILDLLDKKTGILSQRLGSRSARRCLPGWCMSSTGA
jgi:hypothetical protein